MKLNGLVDVDAHSQYHLGAMTSAKLRDDWGRDHEGDGRSALNSHCTDTVTPHSFTNVYFYVNRQFTTTFRFWRVFLRSTITRVRLRRS
jgi:hypothetical protein